MRILLSALLIITYFSCPAQQLDHRPWTDTTLTFEERVDLLINSMTLEQKMSQLSNQSPSIESLGIPKYDWWNEALHGVARSARATVFPQAIGLAATFDDSLMYEIANIISDEARAINNHIVSKGKDQIRYMGLTFWSPNVNIYRDPRWGRGQETYGEDPYLSGKMGAAFVSGMQGNHPKYLKTAACAKHFVVHSGPEAERHSFNAVASPKDLYETYLPAFKSCVEAGVEAIMCAYNRTNNEACCGSNVLLTEILRQDWGFKGHVVSDCGALENFHNYHKLTTNLQESAALALKSGVDINCGNTYDQLAEAVKQGLINEKYIDQSVKRVLMTRFKLGMFDARESNPYSLIPISIIGSSKHQQKALETAQKSIVLLQNKNNVLPLSKELSFIYLGGPFAADARALLGNYYGLSDNLITLVEGVMGKVSPSTRVQYRTGTLVNSPNKNPIDWYSKLAERADVTIATVGLTSLIEGEEGEAIASEAKGDNLSMQLPENQIQYLSKISKASKAAGKPLVVIVFAGCPLELTEISEMADAILYAWYPGEQGGNALADILFGDVSPSGKLPVTFPKSVNQLPPYDDYSMKNRTYRYITESPFFPFGFGKTYTKFSLDSIQFSVHRKNDEKRYKVSASVVNVGNCDSEEVVQLYISLLDSQDTVPNHSLVGFNRVYLRPGESFKLTWQLTPDTFSYIDNRGIKQPYSGKIRLIMGNASPGVRSKELDAVFVEKIVVID